MSIPRNLGGRPRSNRRIEARVTASFWSFELRGVRVAREAGPRQETESQSEGQLQSSGSQLFLARVAGIVRSFCLRFLGLDVLSMYNAGSSFPVTESAGNHRDVFVGVV